MKQSKSKPEPKTKRRTRPMSDPDARENELICLASNLAEQQLRDGTASSQVLVHYLKLGSAKARLEKRYLEKQIDLAEAKTKSYKAAEQSEATAKAAVEAMKRYQGSSEDYEDDSYLY